MRNFILITSIVFAIALGYFATTVAPKHIITGFAAILISILAFFSPKASLILFIFSMLLSPEISLGVLSESRNIVFRYDDILLVIIFLSWFARTAIMKDKSFVIDTSVQTPILIFTIICVVSTAFGILRGEVSYLKSFFYVLKYIEYFLLYFMVVNIVENEEDIKKYLKYFGIVAIIVTIYALFYYFTSSGYSVRATAPFEAPFGAPQTSEPASLGGYYLIIFGLLLGFMVEGSLRVFGLALVLLAFMFPAFLFTFSRASYIGFVAMFFAFLFFTRKKKLLMISTAFIGLFALGIFQNMSKKVENRIIMTFSGESAVNKAKVMGIEISMESSAYARYDSLKNAITERLPKRPFLGWGVTGVGIGDTQYALLLGETGLIGFFIFFWMIYRIFYAAKKVYRVYNAPWIKAISLGLMISLVGLLFQSVGVNTFIVVRIMEPFWFLTALIMVLHRNINKDIKN
ncbi:MAG: O-antigen ligase family protein [Elusimicrobia bacterium]|nr:O-antigen ligase family protein [Elusimicrobiota bacterium]